ncbi:hypothetical protein CEXT_755491 [Caerostris extrusa]|uniref:Uncharacterized protein n=1 Tax=Caerostris extrusa TaxID=172846 RepID=A0AAV4P6A2_CAEEX|nr:hypothetical protein CEXT_755491 [Caerostris extrusa]
MLEMELDWFSMLEIWTGFSMLEMELVFSVGDGTGLVFNFGTCFHVSCTGHCLETKAEKRSVVTPYPSQRREKTFPAPCVQWGAAMQFLLCDAL